MKTLKKKYSVSAFLDILGYRDLIQNDSQEKEIELFNDLKNTIDIALKSTVYSAKDTLRYLDSVNENSTKISDRLNVKQFSDNIYFSFDYEEGNEIDFHLGIYVVSNLSSSYQRLMLGKGYFIRGGIACGLNLLDRNFIFSTALIKAVEIEKETIYPRITLHSELKEELFAAKNNPFKEITQGLYVQDWSDNLFLNPFNQISRVIKDMSGLPQEFLGTLEKSITPVQRRLINKINKEYTYFSDDKLFNSKARGQITKRIKKYKNRNQSIYEKYLWLRNFLNWVEDKPSDLKFKYI